MIVLRELTRTQGQSQRRGYRKTSSRIPSIDVLPGQNKPAGDVKGVFGTFGRGYYSAVVGCRASGIGIAAHATRAEADGRWSGDGRTEVDGQHAHANGRAGLTGVRPSRDGNQERGARQRNSKSQEFVVDEAREFAYAKAGYTAAWLLGSAKRTGNRGERRDKRAERARRRTGPLWLRGQAGGNPVETFSWAAESSLEKLDSALRNPPIRTRM